MTKRKIVAFLMAATMVTSMGAMTANANNHSDSPFTFNFSNSSVRTGARSKTDATSSYMKCKSAGASYTAHVYGLRNGTVQDCSMGRTYQFTGGTTRYMINNVYESGLRASGIYGTRNYGYSYTASGVWSPDIYRLVKRGDSLS
ncbi:MAG: DUF2712 domain-containing protein [[Clostridium] nexile]